MPIQPAHIWANDATSRTLADVGNAANFLVFEWPTAMMDTSAHRAAKVLALDVPGGHVATSQFSMPLVVAAEEAGIPAAAAPTRAAERPLRAHAST